MTGCGFSIPIHTFWPAESSEPLLLLVSFPLLWSPDPYSILVYILDSTSFGMSIAVAASPQPHCT